MSLNRFAALYFATRRLRVNDFPLTGIAIIGAFGIAVLYTALGFRPNCGFVFYPSTFTWDKEYTDCATGMSTLIFYTVVAIATWTNTLNIATAFKLTVDKSVIQDCLHVIDLVNSIFIFKLNDALWFQFIFLSISFLLIHALDGFVMLYFHPEVHPKCLHGKGRKTSSKIVTIATPTFHGDRKVTTVMY
uniref:7TM_GPCR_Srx domain-containing protein n=1 Tax=Caenorhabditis tropicalis TaxID=1561998 RepID=A0A1I7U2E6_9PELO